MKINPFVLQLDNWAHCTTPQNDFLCPQSWFYTISWMNHRITEGESSLMLAMLGQHFLNMDLLIWITVGQQQSVYVSLSRPYPLIPYPLYLGLFLSFNPRRCFFSLQCPERALVISLKESRDNSRQYFAWFLEDSFITAFAFWSTYRIAFVGMFYDPVKNTRRQRQNRLRSIRGTLLCHFSAF